MACGAAQHDAAHTLFMSLPQQLCDRATHRIADGYKRRDAEHIGECRRVVGAIFELEICFRANASPVSTQVECDNIEVFAQYIEAGEPVEVGGCCPAVQQHKGRCTIWAFFFAIKSFASTRQFNFVTIW